MLTTTTTEAEPYEQMTQLEEPVKVEMLIDDYWITHELRLNDEQTLLYAPKSFKIGDDYFLNDKEAYFIRTASIYYVGGYRYESIDVEEVKDLLKE